VGAEQEAKEHDLGAGDISISLFIAWTRAFHSGLVLPHKVPTEKLHFLLRAPGTLVIGFFALWW